MVLQIRWSMSDLASLGSCPPAPALRIMGIAELAIKHLASQASRRYSRLLLGNSAAAEDNYASNGAHFMRRRKLRCYSSHLTLRNPFNLFDAYFTNKQSRFRRSVHRTGQCHRLGTGSARPTDVSVNLYQSFRSDEVSLDAQFLHPFANR